MSELRLAILALIYGCASSSGAQTVETGRLQKEQETWRSQVPRYGEQYTGPQAPNVTRLVLGNGIPVYVVERHTLPLVAIRLVVVGGARTDPSNRPGLARFVAEMLHQGVGGRSALDIVGELEAIGASLVVEPGLDATSVVLELVAANIAPALDLLAAMVTRPTFPPEQLERLRKNTLLELRRTTDSGRRVARERLRRLLYGSVHPYGQPVEGVQESVSTFSRDEVLAHHQMYWHPGSVSIIVVGDVASSDVSRLLEPRFGAWKATAAARSVPPSPTAKPSHPGIYLVDSPGARQSSIAMGHLVSAKSSIDWPAIDTMNSILGGMHSSRISLNLRESKGYTYYVRSQLARRIDASHIQIVGEFSVENTAAAVSEMRTEIVEMRTRRVDKAELERARSNIRYTLSYELQSNAGAARMLESGSIFDSPTSFLDKYMTDISAVSQSSVDDAVRTYLDSKLLVVVVRGPAVELRKQFERASIGPLVSLPE